MLEIVQKRIELYVHKLIARIEEALAAIALIQEKPMAFVPLCDDPVMETLSNFVNQLKAEKEELLTLLRRLNSVSVSAAKEICMELDALADKAAQLEAVEAALSVNLKNARCVCDVALSENVTSETAQMLAAVEAYSAAGEELKRACHESADYLRKQRELYCNSEERLADDFKRVSLDGETRYAHPVLSAAAPPRPPVQANYASKAAEPAKQSSAHQIEKTGLWGLFKRKKQADNNSETNEVVPPPCVDSVLFSAVAPNRVVPGKYLPVNILMYEEAFRKAVDDVIQAHGKNAKETKSGYHDVERNALVRVVLTSCDVAIEDGEAEQVWNGKYLNFAFAAKIPGDFAEEQILLSATVYINDIIATKLKLILDCEKKPKRNISVTREDIVSAFVSYASQDRNRVAAIIQGMQKARPDMDIFFDVESLHSGQKWEDALKNEIESRDVLFLCWSRAARDSQWVEMEWRYALECKGEDCIEPIPIDPPDVCPPPAELRQKHFHDKLLFVIQATIPESSGQPYLVRTKTQECFPIDKPVVRIGKEKAYVDIAILDNTAVSRSHANIISRNGMYYIVDTNSVNHTYVDGSMIPSNVETLLYHGARIKLANEDFTFFC